MDRVGEKLFAADAEKSRINSKENVNDVNIKTEIKALTKRECFLHAFFRPGAARRLKRTGAEVA